MSADNGLLVVKLNDSDNYGIFHYMGEHSPAKLTRHARQVYSEPVAAIIAAHELQRTERTEYGVHVDKNVLQDCTNYMALANRIK